MTVLHAVDLQLKQIQGGALCVTTYSYLSDSAVGLTVANLIDVADFFVSTILPQINAVQSPAVQNVSVNLRGRGTTVPTYFEPVSGNGLSLAAAITWMPPEFNFWFRYGVDITLDSIPGTPDVDHPIQRGGAFIVGATDDYLEDGVYSISPGGAADWIALESRFTASFPAGALTMTPAVLGEEIVPGTGWRIAEITAAIPLRITRLKSRLAIS